MALQIIKLAVEAASTVDLNPDVKRFFYINPTLEIGPKTLTIDAADFLDDNGAVVTALPTLNGNNSYYHVYINGALQMEGVSTFDDTTGSLSIIIESGTTIIVGTPIVLEIANYTPTAITTTET